MTNKDLEILAILGEEALELYYEINENNFDLILKETADLIVAISLFENKNIVKNINRSSNSFDINLFKFNLLELSKLCFKTIRFGFDSFSPFDPEFKSNKNLILEKIDFLNNHFFTFFQEFNIDLINLENLILKKKEKLKNYSFYQIIN